MSTNPASADRRRLAELADGEQRDRLFGQRPDLVRRETVRWLGEETARQVVVDLELARRLAATALRLAETLGDPLSTALAWRAVANTLLFGREYPAAASAYETAIDELDRLGEQHQAAITRSSAISCLSYLGHYDQATEYAAEARRQFRLADDTLRLARLENNVAHLLARRDRFADALDHYRQAHSLLSQMGEPADVAMVLRNTAVCHQELGDLEQALSSYAEARSWCARNGLDRIGLEVEYNAAYLCFLRGEYTRALTLFEAVRRSCEAAGDEHHRALCDLDQAEIFLELNLVSDAALLAERCIDGFAVLGMDYELAKALAYAGLAAARRDDVGSARALWARARRLFEGEDNEVWVAMVDLYEAHSQHTSGRHREAEALAATALATFTRFAIPSRQAACEILLARLALESRDRPRAGTLVADALAHATSAGRPILELQAHLLGGLVEEAAGNGSAALTALERAEATLERMRGQLVTDELKIAFGDDKQAIYEALVTIGLASDSTDREQRAFENVEKAKSRGLADLLAFGVSELRPAAEGFDKVDERIRQLRRELSWLYRQLDAEELRVDGRSMEKVARLLGDCRHHEAQLLRHQRRLLSADAELASLQGAAPADIEAVVEVLPEDGALLEYYVARGVVYAFLLDRGGLGVRRVSRLDDLRELQQQLGFQLDKFRLGPEYVEQFGRFLDESTRVLLRRLYDELLAPLEAHLDLRHLVVVPHGILHHLPFHALHDGKRYLLDRCAISYAPSATAFRLCSLRRPRPMNRSLVLGVPDQRAPLILEEVRAVHEQLPDLRLLLGEEATAEALARFGGGCRILHLATHGLHRSDNPMFSAIQMGGSRLSLMDLYGIRLEA